MSSEVPQDVAKAFLGHLLLTRLKATEQEFRDLVEKIEARWLALDRDGEIRTGSAGDLAADVVHLVTTALMNAGLSGLVRAANDYDRHLPDRSPSVAALPEERK